MVLFDTDRAFFVQYALVLRQSHGRLESVPDLSAVEVEVPDRGPFDVVLCADRDPDQFHAFASKLLDERVPNLLTVFVRKGRVEEFDVDARGEGVVKGADAVCGQEEHAFEHLEGAEEASDEAVAIEVIG